MLLVPSRCAEGDGEERLRDPPVPDRGTPPRTRKELLRGVEERRREPPRGEVQRVAWVDDLDRRPRRGDARDAVRDIDHRAEVAGARRSPRGTARPSRQVGIEGERLSVEVEEVEPLDVVSLFAGDARRRRERQTPQTASPAVAWLVEMTV